MYDYKLKQNNTGQKSPGFNDFDTPQPRLMLNFTCEVFESF